MRGRVLIVDDDAAMCEALATELEGRGFAPIATTSAEAAMKVFASGDLDVVVTDLKMPGTSGIALCERIVANRPDVPVIVVTAFGSLETAVAAIRAGAYDFITKPLDADVLAHSLDRAIQHRTLREEVKRLKSAVTEARRFDDLIGASAPMQALFELVDRSAESDASVLVTGETGTGKEAVARALHRRGRRARGPFLAVNCAALPEALLESELFGHVKGAFTDAKAARPGLLLGANGGTLFLDEIGDMPLALQPKLLRALQERKVRPVGGDNEVPFDARIVAATHKDLEAAAEGGSFRQDLYFRIAVITIEVPPLRVRGGDVLLIAQALLERCAERAGKKIAGLGTGAAERLLAYGWPGNVRELQNCVERAVALAQHDQIKIDDLPEKIRTARPTEDGDLSSLVPLEEIERRYILRVLEAAEGNKTLAARVLGLDRMTLYRKLKRYGVSGEDPS